MRLLLASRSPRRQQLLQQMGLDFVHVSVECDEDIDRSPDELAEALAVKKSDAYGALEDGDVLLTADTTVLLDHHVLNKPNDRAHAIAMLQRLSGRQHIVRTGVCLRSPDRRISFAVSTTVRFRTLSPLEIAHYVDTYRPFDKAGAYGIQEWIGLVGVEGIEGCYYNVMGLPCPRVYEAIKRDFPELLA